MKKNKDKKQIFNIILLVAITILVMFFALKDNFNEIINEIIHANILWLIVGIFLYLGNIFLRSISLRSLIQEFKPNYSMKQTLRLTLLTQFFNAVTPFATGGQPFQIYYLKKSGVNLTNSTNIIIQNFIVYQIALVILGTFAVISNHFFHIFKEVGLLKDLVTIGFIINSAIIVLLFFITFGKKFNKFVTRLIIKVLDKAKLIKDKESIYEKWEDYINNFSQGAKILVTKKGLMLKCILLNLAGLCSLYIIPLVVAFSLGHYFSFNGLEAIIASAYVMIIGSFVPIPGGTGGLEYGFVEFYGNFITGGALSAIMLLWRFITYYLGMIIGAIVLNTYGNEE